MENRLSYSVKEAQSITGLGKNTIFKLIAEGQIHSVRAGKRILIPLWAIEKFLAGETAATSEPVGIRAVK